MKQDEELDFFGISKESDQTKNEMGLFLGLMVFGSALLFFMLPVLCITLVLTYFLQRKFTLKVEWGLFLIFAVSFGLALFRYGYLPLLQYGVIWKSFFPQFVNFFEKIVQNGTPFQVTNTSYFLGFLLIGTCTNLFLLISRRLKRTWFTKEKEQKKTDYLESDKFKKFFKERHRIIEKEQEKYRQSENKRIYLGMSVEKINEYLDINSLFTHSLVQGTTGCGKTTLIYGLLEGGLRNGLGGVFVDGKGDIKTEAELRKLASAYGKEVIVFSDQSKYHYNPVKYGKPTAIKDRLMSVMDWSESFYEKESENMLQMILSFIQDYIDVESNRTDKQRSSGQGKRLKMDLETIHRFLDLYEIANYLFLEQSEQYLTDLAKTTEKKATGLTLTEKDLPLTHDGELLHEKYIRYFFKQKELNYGDLDEIQEMKGEEVKLIRGLRTQLELIIYSDFGNKFVESKKQELNIDLLAEIKKGNIVLLSFSATNYAGFIQVLGRFIISDVGFCVSQLHKNEVDFKGAIGIFDELGFYINERILSILGQARSAKLGAVLGIQSISDLVTPFGDFTGRIIDNVNLFFLGRSNYATNAEEASNTIGTYADIDRTVMTENQGGVLNRWETRGERGTVKKVRKYWFGPDEIKDMPNYTFTLTDKTKDRLEPYKEKIFIRNTMAGL